MIRSLLLALTFALLIAAPAAASAPIDLGPGAAPAVVVDEAGTAHITFGDRARRDRSTAGCRAARSRATCARTLPFADNRRRRPTILRRPDGALIVVRSPTCRRALGHTPHASWFASPPTAARPGRRPAVLATGRATASTPSSSTRRPAVACSRCASSTALRPSLQRAPFDGRRDARARNSTTIRRGHAAPTWRCCPTAASWSPTSDLGGRLAGALFGGGDALRHQRLGHPRHACAAVENAVLAAGPRGMFLLEHRAAPRTSASRVRAPFALRSFDTRARCAGAPPAAPAADR